VPTDGNALGGCPVRVEAAVLASLTDAFLGSFNASKEMAN